MAIVIGAAVVAGGAITSSVVSSNAAGSAADAQAGAARDANATQLQMYNTTRQDQAPWRQAGGQAVNALSQWYGLGGVNTAPQTSSPGQQGYAPSSGMSIGPGGVIRPMIPGGSGSGGQGAGQARVGQPGQVDLTQLPGYQFQLQQGQQAVDRNLAARGLLNSGAAAKALTAYGQGMASDYATQYVNGLQSLAGLGQTSVANTGALGANAANQVGANQIYAGNAAASGAVGQANAINSGLSGLVGAYGQYSQAQQSPWTSYNSALATQQSNQTADYFANQQTPLLNLGGP